MLTIDLNCDLGEGGPDDQLIPFITSANIACGVHAGNPDLMSQTVRKALARGVALGAHPGLAGNFGRDPAVIEPAAIYNLIISQVRALTAIARSCGGRLRHVKPHGALYNHSFTDQTTATAICTAIRDLDPALLVYAQPDSALAVNAAALGLQVVREAFADRGYLPDGQLVERSRPGALLQPAEAVRQAVEIVCHHRVITSASLARPLQAETLCIHGDTPGAARLLTTLRAELRDCQVAFRPPESSNE